MHILRKRREALGLSPPKLAAAVGVPYGCYIKLENQKESPLTTQHTWRTVALKLAEYFKVVPEELFPEAALEIERTEAAIRVDAEITMAGLTDAPRTPLELLLGMGEEQANQVALAAVTQLPTRSRAIVQAFLDGERVGEIAEQIGVSRSRVGQILQSTADKLRTALNPEPVQGQEPRTFEWWWVPTKPKPSSKQKHKKVASSGEKQTPLTSPQGRLTK